MQARATLPYPVTAFAGREYVAYEWRPVPAGCDAEARRHPYLELQEPPDSEAVEVDATDAARELAAEHSIDLAAVDGTGADGRVLVGDVRARIEEGA